MGGQVGLPGAQGEDGEGSNTLEYGCNGRTCGDDGAGVSCGVCEADTEVCSPGGYCVNPLAAPVVSSEGGKKLSPNPVFTWTLGSDVERYRTRLKSPDSEEWGLWEEYIDTAGSAVLHKESNLDDGVHTLGVQYIAGTGTNESVSAETTVVFEVKSYEVDGYWDVEKDIATSPLDNKVAVIRHNCYEAGKGSSDLNRNKTRYMTRRANVKGADVVELDVEYCSSGWLLYNSSDSCAIASPALTGILDDSALMEENTLLLIEVRKAPTKEAIWALLSLLNDRRDSYAHNGRPVLLGNFMNNGTVVADLLQEILVNDGEFPLIRDFIWPQGMIDGNNPKYDQPNEGISKVTEEIDRLDDLALSHPGVHFDITGKNLFSAIVYARNKKIGVGVWTLKDLDDGIWQYHEALIAALRESVDMMTLEFPVKGARAEIDSDTTLFFLDAWNQKVDSALSYSKLNTLPGSNGAFTYTRTDGDVATFEIFSGATFEEVVVNLDLAGVESERPELQSADNDTGNDTVGYDLLFDGDNDHIPLWDIEHDDGDENTSEGILVSAVFNLDNWAILGEGSNPWTRTILGKCQDSGWCLELICHDDNSNGNCQNGEIYLQFSIYSTGYHDARVPLQALLTDAGYSNTGGNSLSLFIIGLYDGDGNVTLLVDGQQEGTQTDTSGPILDSGKDAFLGADASGTVTPEKFFQGHIQMATVLRWPNHH